MDRIKFHIHVEEDNYLYLDVSPLNVKACECYKKMGFEINFQYTRYQIPKIVELTQRI